MTMPDFMPRLAQGCHYDPSEGACVMEYVSFITGDTFTDTPACTPHNLALLAQYANDNISDDEARARLLTPLIPRLLGAGHSDEYDARLKQFLYGLVQTEGTPEDGHWVRSNGGIWANAGALASIRMSKRSDPYTAEFSHLMLVRDEAWTSVLVDALDDYDLFLKREKPESLTPAQVNAVERLTALITS